jgi:hypothetical protein
MRLFDLYHPLSNQSGDIGSISYLLQTEFPLLLANTAFDYEAEALPQLKALFGSAEVPLSFTLKGDSPAIPELSAMGYGLSASFHLCPTQPSVRAQWAEHVPWSEAWTIANILTEAHGVPQWRFPLSQTLGKALRTGGCDAFVSYMYGEAVGAIVTHQGVGILAGVLPKRANQGVGASLLARIHPAAFIRMEGQEAEFAGEVQHRFIRLVLESTL